MRNKLVAASTLSVTLALLSLNTYGMNLSVSSLDSSSKINKEKVEVSKSDIESSDSSFSSESGAVLNIDTEERKEKKSFTKYWIKVIQAFHRDQML